MATKSLHLPAKIGHGGDLHFFQNKRHIEYDELTDTLCELIVREGIELFYFGGDIIDSKTKLSPEQVRSIKRLIQKVTDLVPTIWILGNHDLNLKNKHRLDALTPFLEDLEPKFPVHFIKHSGIYTHYGINWAVWSCLDDQKNPFDDRPSESIPEGPIIGCYHGVVDGAIADNDTYKMKGRITIDEFKNCDVVFLNDIHKRQSFRNGEIQYSGSWCQTKVSEDEEKGILVWNWNAKKNKYVAEFKELPKSFGYRTYEVTDLTTFKLPDDELPRAYIPRLLYTGDANAYSPTLMEGLKKQLQVKVDTEVITQVKPFNSKKTIVTTKQKGKVVDFFEEYFKGLEYDTDQIEALKLVDAHYSKMIDLSDYESGQYEIEEVTVHNFMSYGPNNTVRWADMQGIIGLFAPNRTGKSTLLDAVMFCLYNRTSRVSKPGRELINDQLEEEAYVEAKIIVNGAKWRVKRTLTPNKDTVSTTLEVYEVVNNKEVPRHKESRKHTEPLLRKMFGDAEIFLITSLCTQKKPVEFVDCTNAERLDLFLRFLGITAYEQKHELAKDDLATKETECNVLRKELEGFEGEESINNKIDVAKNEIAINEDIVKQKQKEINVNNKEINTVRDLVEALQVVELSKTVEELENELASQKLQIENKRKAVKEQETEYKESLAKWEEQKLGDVSKWVDNNEEEKPYLTKLETLRFELEKLELRQVAKTKEQLDEEKTKIAASFEEKTLKKITLQTTIEAILAANADIEVWEADPFEDVGPNKKISNAEAQIEHLTKELESEICPTCKQKRVEFNREEIETKIEEFKQIIQANKLIISKNLETRTAIQTQQKEFFKAKAELKLLKSELSNVDTLLENINKSLADLIYNEKTQEDRQVVRDKIEVVKNELGVVREERTKVADLHRRITTLVTSIDLNNAQIDLANSKIKEIERDIQTWNDNKTNRKKRELLKAQIEELEQQNEAHTSIKQSAEVVVMSLNKEILNYQQALDSFAEKHKELLVKEREYNYQVAYLKAMHRNGIPSLILQTYIPDINFEINDNLQGLFDFSVFFELDDKNLDIYFTDNSIKHNKRSVTQTSGVEGFVINLAIRAALTRISLLPKPSIFMIDEGFTVSDTDNLELLKELLLKFRNQYTNIVMITHLDDLKDFPEFYITLEKKNGVTSILS